MITREEFLKEIKKITDKINNIEKMMNEYVNNVHQVSTDSIISSESTIIDLEIEVENVKNQLSTLSDN